MLAIVDQVSDELRGIWRFHWVALAIAWGVSTVGWLVVLSIPDMYEAQSRVYVDTRTPLRPLLEGVAVEQDIESQIVMVRQALLGGPTLERVAREAGLLHAGTLEERQTVVGNMAARISVELEPSISRDPRIPNTFYKIMYQDPNRENAVKVVDLLLNSFVDSTFGTKHESAATAHAFLKNQLTQYRERLTAAENALAEFKRRNIGMVPGEGSGFFQRLDEEQAKVQRVEAELRVALSRKAELGRQLSGESAFVPYQAAAGSGGGSREAPADTASRIQETQARLDELLLRFTDKHPDVIATRQALEDLRARQVQEIEAVRRGDAGAAAIAGATSNPVYQSIQLQLHETDVQVAALRGEINDYRGNVAALRLALDTAPEVEAEYKRLTRDYEVTQTQYNALLQRFEQARVSEDAQQTGIVEFRIVDPPTAPFNPVFPNRPLLLAGVLVAAVGLGAGVAWLLSKLRPVFHHGRTLAEITGLPVIGVVSLAWLERHRAMLKQDYLRYAAVAGMLLVMTIVVVVTHASSSRLLQGLMS